LSCCRRRFYEANKIDKKVKEYKDILKFEGEYLYGKRNGKGKEYDINGKLIFEGDYLNDQRKNEINEKNKLEHHLISEVSLKNGAKNGIEKGYDEKGKIIYEKEYKNRIINGKVKENYGFYKFEGEFKDGKYWNGKVKEYYDNILKFDGE